MLAAIQGDVIESLTLYTQWIKSCDMASSLADDLLQVSRALPVIGGNVLASFMCWVFIHLITSCDRAYRPSAVRERLVDVSLQYHEADIRRRRGKNISAIWRTTFQLLVSMVFLVFPHLWAFTGRLTTKIPTGNSHAGYNYSDGIWGLKIKMSNLHWVLAGFRM